MGIFANPEFFELEDDGEISQELVGIRYTGGGRRYDAMGAVNQGRFPARTDFQSDVWYLGFVPDTTPSSDAGTGLAWFERSDAFDVEYDREALAEILLGKNYVDLAPAGPNADEIPGDFEARVRDELGLEDPIDAGATTEEQLATLGDVDVDDEDVGERTQVEELVEENDRAGLKERVKDVRSGPDEFSLSSATMEDLAQFLVDNDPSIDGGDAGDGGGGTEEDSNE